MDREPESDDPLTWELTRMLTGDRSEMMRNVRMQYLERDPPLRHLELINILLITNSVEESFFLFSKIEREFNPISGIHDHIPQA